MTNVKTPVAPVEYPLLADRTIAVGDRVRSFDFPGNPTCYFVGTVTGVTDLDQYNIEVEYQVWENMREPTNFCKSVHPPINGVEGIFGPMRGVQRITEGV
jgi:hypothetical protein